MCSTHMMDYYSDIKRNGVLTHAAAWTDPEHMLSDRSQTQTATPCVISVTGSMRNTNIHGDKV